MYLNINELKNGISEKFSDLKITTAKIYYLNKFKKNS